ncbi:unnamed protein product, partial [Toxocara canis]
MHKFSAPPQYKKWVEQKHAVVIEEKVETISSERIGVTVNQAPKFINQVPNLTLKPGAEAVIDVEVEASPPAKFTWFVNGVEFRDSLGRIEVYYPKANRCVARFPIPQTGEYKVIAENSLGKDQSIGYVDIKKEVSAHQMQRPPLPAELQAGALGEQRHQDLYERTDLGRASSVTKNYEVYEESLYYQRSTSLPRPTRSLERHLEFASNRKMLDRHQEEADGQQPHSSMSEIYRAVEREDGRTETTYRAMSESSHFIPQPPTFTTDLPEAIHLSPKEKLVLSVDVKASPQAEIRWNVDGIEVKQSKDITILNERNRSTLVVKPPVHQGRYSAIATNEAGTSTLGTMVHCVQEETFEQIDEHMIICDRKSTAVRGRSTPPEIVENAITVTSAQDGWELVDEVDAMKSSTESFETVRLADGARFSIGRNEDETPKPPLRSSVHTSSHTEKISEEYSTTAMESSVISTPKSVQQIEMFATEVAEEMRQVPIPRKVSEPLPKRPSVLKQPPPEVRVKAGEKLVLESKVESYPASSFKWYHNNFEVRPSSTVQIDTPAPNESRATFHKPTDGIYKVTATNIHGSCSSSTRVVVEVIEELMEVSSVSIVRAPQPPPPIQQFQFVRKGRIESRKDLPMVPKIKKKFAPLIRVPQKEPLVLSIEVDAIPEANFTWRVNNFEIRPSALVHIERPAPNVSRATFTKPTQGRYEVIASNELGSDTCTTKVAIDFETEMVSEMKTVVVPPPVPPKPPKFIRPLPAETEISEDIKEFELYVIVDAQQPVTFRWFADGSLLSNSIEHQMLNEALKSTLIVRRPLVHPTDYAVEVSNRNGTIWSETKVSHPIVKKTSATVEELLATEATTEVRQRGPRFTTPLYPVELNEDDHFTAEVIVDHDGTPCEFLWYLNERDVRTVPGFRVDSTHYKSTIVVDSATSKHSGKLSVIARNKYGTAQSSATVCVNKKEESFEVIPTAMRIPSERPPKIIQPLHSAVFKSGEPLVLRCRIDALPPAQITWSKDEIDLAEWVISEDITTTVLPDGTYELSKPQCTTEDAGFYQCTARNAYGKAQTAAYVTVEEMLSTEEVHETEIHEITITKSPTPYVPQEPPKFVEALTTLVEDDRTVLMCKVHSEAPVEISWYRNDVQLQQTDKYTMHSLANGTQTLTIKNVTKQDEGMYTCRAESRYGSAETSSQVKTTKEEKRTSVEEVLIEEHNDEQIRMPLKAEFKKRVYTDVKRLKTNRLLFQVYTDTSLKLVTETEITDSEENYSRTAELRKNEEEYKLLVKVAETVARRLVAKVVIDEAVREAVSRLREDVRTSDEEEIFYETISEERFFAPRFETNIECYNVRVGDTVQLATDVRGHPTPTVEWYFGQQRLQQSDRTEILFSNGRSMLVIKKARKEDEGTYFCHAHNRFGTAVLACNLRVIDTSADRTQSTLDFSKTTKYVSSETESEVFSNVHVNHSEETFEHHVAFLQPQTIALGYDCRASTSKVYDDSVIIRREETTLIRSSEYYQPIEKEITLNVNVEKPSLQFTHDVRILQPREMDASLLSKEPWIVRSEEIMQTTDITLTEKQRRAHGQDSTVNTCATVVIEKPPQRAIHEVTCIYDEMISLPEERFHAVTSVEIKQMEAVNELFSSVLARKDEHQAHEVANVEVRRPSSHFDHTTTVVESEIAHLSAHLTAPATSRSELVLVELDLRKYSPELSDEITRIQRPIRRATAQQRVVILEGATRSFSEEVIWSLRKVRKSAALAGEAIMNANIEVRKPSEQGEHVTTIIDTAKIIPEILAIAAAATQVKITNVFITLTKKGEVAHQALVIEYESFVEDEAALNVVLLTAPAFHSKQEETWTRDTKVIETYDERNIVAVFVEVDANCPDQSVELVASVSIPIVSNANLSGIQRWSTTSFMEESTSISESSTFGIFQAPKFLKKLENVTSAIGTALQFKCIVSGMPMPEIRWFVDGDEIRTSTEYETVYEDGVCILRINEVVIEDEGEYICEATNPAGRAITKCFLHTTTTTDYDDIQWRRKLSKKSLSEEANSYILFEANPIEEAIEVQAFIVESGVKTPRSSSVYEDSHTTVGTVDGFDFSLTDNFISKDFLFYGQLSNAKVSITIAEPIQQVGLSANVHTVRGEEVECFFYFYARNSDEKCEIICRYMITENLDSSHRTNSICDETTLSLHMSRPGLVENAAIIEIASIIEQKANSQITICDVFEDIVPTKRFPIECLPIVMPIRKEKAEVELSMIMTHNVHEVDSNLHFVRNVHNFSDLSLTKEEQIDSAHATMARETSPIAINACVEVADSDLWNKKFENPFPEESSRIRQVDEDKLYEPRTPLLPQKVTYKGHEIGLSVHEVGKMDETDMKIERQIIERCVEAIFDLDSTIGGCIEENRISKDRDVERSLVFEQARMKADNIAAIDNIRLVENGIEPSNGEFITKIAEGTVMTEEDIDMFQEDEISELVMEIIEETEERSRLEDLSDTSFAEENQVLFCSFRKISDHDEAIENRGNRIPSPSDAHKELEATEQVVTTANQEYTSHQQPRQNDLKDSSYLTEIKQVEQIVRQVESELEDAHVRDSSGSLNEDVLLIERAIYDISDRIVQQQPVTEAQAEASEELLRATLEEIIMDIPTKSSKGTSSVYRKPIALLKQKLTDLEKSFIVDEEVEVPVNNADMGRPQSWLTGASSEAGTSREQNATADTKKVIVKRMSSEFARMTPITANIQRQLTTLETMLDEVELEEVEDSEEATTETTKLLMKKPASKHRELHGILVQINNELNTMKRYCRRNISKKGADAVVGVLHKVRNNVASIVNLVSGSRRRRRSRTVSPDKHFSKSGFFFRTDASINFNLFKAQADESINVIVIYRSASQERFEKNLQNGITIITESAKYQCGYKLCASSAEKAITPESERGIVVFSNGLSMDDSAESSTRIIAKSADGISAVAPIPPPRLRRSSISEDEMPVRPPRPRRSQSRDVEEKRLIEMLVSQPNEQQFTLSPVQVAEISRLHEELKGQVIDLERHGAYIGADGILNETETQELEVRRRSSVENVLAVLPFSPHRKAFFTTFDETISVQLLCEESDYGNESDTGSRTLFGSAKMHPTYAIHEASIPELNEKNVTDEQLSTALVEGGEPKSFSTQESRNDSEDHKETNACATQVSGRLSQKSDSTAFTDVEVDVILTQFSESFNEDDSIGIDRRVANDPEQISSNSDFLMRGNVVESSSLNDIESLLGRDESAQDVGGFQEVYCTNTATVDMLNIMPTIMERSENSRTNSSALSVSRTSAVNPNVHEDDGALKDCISDCLPKGKSKLTENDEIYGNIFEEVYLNLNWKRRFQKYNVLCALSPDIRMSISASAVIGNCFEVIVEQASEAQGYLVKIMDDVCDSISLSIIEMAPVTVDVDISLSNDEQIDFEEVVAVQADHYKMFPQNTNELNPIHSGIIADIEDCVQQTGVSISIVARSIRDIVYASLEEIPWGEVSMNIYLTENELTRSTSHCDSENRTNSFIQNVTVSESNENERKSLRSQESFKSSQKSLALSDRTDRYDSMQSLNIPSYVLKERSTATITCELNNFLSPTSHIDWYKGKLKVETLPGKIDRISHDLLEVLVISHVELNDSDVYSIQVDDQVYPVACLIVEEESQPEKIEEAAAPRFLSPQQTLFVMEGQPAIISCQVSVPKQKIIWCKEKKMIDDNNRFKIESDDDGFHRLIISDCELEDQGTYYAYLGNQFTSITLVVEEQIDERELTVTASGTESEDDDFREYIVPPGSTATIACELEKSDELRELCWRKNGSSIVFSDDTKMEHVINGLKHYLVIHDTQPSDSASYSVRINNVEFKVAHMTVSDYAASFAGDMTLEETLVPIGASASIHCETITQEVSLNWQKDRRPLPADERYEYFDSADGREHTLTIHGVRKSDEGEYGVVIADSYTAVTKITVIDSDYQLMRGEEATVLQHFTVPSRRPTVSGEATVAVADERETYTYDEYQICDIHEYFDLRIGMQAIEVPVTVREHRSASTALSFDSRESSAGRVEEKIVEVEIVRRETSSTSDEFVGRQKRITETALSAVDMQYEFTRWQKAVEEAIVTESRQLKTAHAMSVDRTNYDVSIECAPFYGRVTMVEKTLAPTPHTSASIHIAQRSLDVDLFSTTTYGMLSVETTRTISLTESGIHLRVQSIHSEALEVGFSIECGTENEQISIVFLINPPITEFNNAAISYAHMDLFTEFSANYAYSINVEMIRRITNKMATWARLEASSFAETENIIIFERAPAKQTLQATITTLAPPLLEELSDNIALIKLYQWLDSSVIREISSHVARKSARSHSEHLCLKATTLEEINIGINCLRESMHREAECILISRPPPMKAQVIANFALQEAYFSFDSTVIRQTESEFVTKMVSKACDFMRLNATTHEEALFDVIIKRDSYQNEGVLISLLSRLPPEKAEVMTDLAWQEMNFFFDSCIDQQIEFNVLAEVVTKAFTSMQLHATILEEGEFGVFMGRRPNQDEVLVTVVAPPIPAIAAVYAGFASQHSHFSFYSSIIREIESHFVTRTTNRSSTSASLYATTLEEGQFDIVMGRVIHQEQALVTLISRPPPENSRVMTNFALHDIDFSFDSTVDQQVERKILTKVLTRALISMQLHATSLEEGEFGVFMQRTPDQEVAFVTLICRPPPMNARIMSNIELQEMSFSFDSFVDQQVEFNVLTKVITKAFTSMQLHATTLEEGEFGVFMGRRPNQDEVLVTVVAPPIPAIAAVYAGFAYQHSHFSFYSSIIREIESHFVTRTTNRSSTSASLYATTLEEGQFDIVMGRVIHQEQALVTLISRPPPENSRVMTNFALHDIDFSFDSTVDQQVERKILTKVLTRALISMQLHATSLEEGEFGVFMQRTPDQEVAFVTLICRPPPMNARIMSNIELQEMSFSFDSFVDQQVEFNVLTKVITKAFTSMQLHATTLEEGEFSVFMERRPYHEHVSVILTSRPSPQKAEVMSNIVWQETDFSLETFVDQQVECNMLTKVVTKAFTSMRLHATTLEEGEFGVFIGRRSDQDHLFVTIIAPVSPVVMKAHAGYARQQTKYSFDSAVVREIKFEFATKTINTERISMCMHATTLEEHEFDATMERKSQQEEAGITLLSRPLPLKADLCADFTWWEMDFSFNSALIRQVEHVFFTKTMSRASASLTLSATTLEEGVFSVLMERRPHQDDLFVTVVRPPSPTKVAVWADFTWQDNDFLLDSTVVREIRRSFFTKAMATERASIQLHTTTEEAGEFGVAMERRSEHDEVVVTILSDRSSGQAIKFVSAISEISQEIELLRTSNEEECITILKEIISDEELSLAEESISTSSQSLAFTKPHFIQKLSNVYELDENSAVTFKCILGGVPSPSVRWFINNNPIDEEDRDVSMVAEDGIYLLKTSSIDRSWVGTLVCEASNSSGTVRSSSTIIIKTSERTEAVHELYSAEQKFETEVKVLTGAPSSLQKLPLMHQSPDVSEMSTTSTTSSAGQPPEFRQPLAKAITVKAGELIQLKCVVSGSPLPVCQWSKDGIIVEENSENTIIFEDGISILRIHGGSLTDSALFRCTANNTFGSAETECRVSVEDESSQDSSTSQAPYFVLPLRDVTCSADEHVQLKCIVAGNPMPTIRWTLNYQEVHEDEKGFKMAYEDGVVLLKMTQNVERGVFACEAINNFGQARTECRVDIKESKDNTLDTTIEASSVNYLVEADVFIFTMLTYKTKAVVKVEEKKKRMDEDFTITIIIEENILRRRQYAYIVERRFKIVRTFGEGNERVIASGELGRSLEQVRHAIEAFLAEEKRKGVQVEGENLERIIEILRVPRIGQMTGESEYEYDEFEEARPQHRSRMDSETFCERSNEEVERLQRRTFVIGTEHILRSDEEELTVADVNCVCVPAKEFLEADVIVKSITKYSVTVHIRCGRGPSADRTETSFEIITESWVKHNSNYTQNTPTVARFVRPFSVAKTIHNIYELRCMVTGYPPPDIRILYNGRPIRHNDRDYRVIYECGIVILRMRHLREGHYVCTATNDSGTARTECYLRADDELDEILQENRIFGRFGRLLPYGTEASSSFVALTGQDSVHQAFKYPAFSFGMPTSFDTQRFSKKEMTFERISRSQRISQGSGKSPYQREGDEASLHEQFSSEFGTSSLQTQLTTQMEDQQTRNLKRFHEGEFFGSAAESAYEKLHEGKHYELHAEQEGTITTTFEKYPRKSEEMSSILDEAPVFTLPLTDIVTEPVDYLELKCIVAGYPRPIIRWTFNDQEIHSDASTTLVYEDGIILLQLRRANIEGHYACEATNQAGYARTECNVYFKRRPMEQKGHEIEFFERRETDERITKISEQHAQTSTVTKAVSTDLRQQRQKSDSEESSERYLEERTYIKPSDESASLDLAFGQKTSADLVEVDMLIRSNIRRCEGRDTTKAAHLQRRSIEDVREDIAVKKNTATANVEIVVIDKVVAGLKKRFCDGPHQESDMNEKIICHHVEAVEVVVLIRTIPNENAFFHIYQQSVLDETGPLIQRTALGTTTFAQAAEGAAYAQHKEHEMYQQQRQMIGAQSGIASGATTERIAEQQIIFAEKQEGAPSWLSDFQEGTRREITQIREKAVGTSKFPSASLLGTSYTEGFTTSVARQAEEKSDEVEKIFDIFGKKVQEKATVVAFFAPSMPSFHVIGSFTTSGTMMTLKGKTIREKIMFGSAEDTLIGEEKIPERTRHIEVELSKKEIVAAKTSTEALIEVSVIESIFAETSRVVSTEHIEAIETTELVVNKEQQVVGATVVIATSCLEAVWFSTSRTMMATRAETLREREIFGLKEEYTIQEAHVIEEIRHLQIEESNEDVALEKAAAEAFIDVAVFEITNEEAWKFVRNDVLQEVEAVEVDIIKRRQMLAAAISTAIIQNEAVHFGTSRMVTAFKDQATQKVAKFGSVDQRMVDEASVIRDARRPKTEESNREIFIENAMAQAFVEASVIESISVKAWEVASEELVEEVEEVEVVVSKEHQMLTAIAATAVIPFESVWLSTSSTVIVQRGAAVKAAVELGSAKKAIDEEGKISEEIERSKIEESIKEIVMEKASALAFIEVSVIESSTTKAQPLVLEERLEEVQAAEVAVNKHEQMLTVSVSIAVSQLEATFFSTSVTTMALRGETLREPIAFGSAEKKLTGEAKVVEERKRIEIEEIDKEILVEKASGTAFVEVSVVEKISTAAGRLISEEFVEEFEAAEVVAAKDQQVLGAVLSITARNLNAAAFSTHRMVMAPKGETSQEQVLFDSLQEKMTGEATIAQEIRRLEIEESDREIVMERASATAFVEVSVIEGPSMKARELVCDGSVEEVGTTDEVVAKGQQMHTAGVSIPMSHMEAAFSSTEIITMEELQDIGVESVDKEVIIRRASDEGATEKSIFTVVPGESVRGNWSKQQDLTDIFETVQSKEVVADMENVFLYKYMSCIDEFVSYFASDVLQSALTAAAISAVSDLQECSIDATVSAAGFARALEADTFNAVVQKTAISFEEVKEEAALDICYTTIAEEHETRSVETVIEKQPNVANVEVSVIETFAQVAAHIISKKQSEDVRAEVHVEKDHEKYEATIVITLPHFECTAEDVKKPSNEETLWSDAVINAAESAQTVELNVANEVVDKSALSLSTLKKITHYAVGDTMKIAYTEVVLTATDAIHNTNIDIIPQTTKRVHLSVDELQNRVAEVATDKEVIDETKADSIEQVREVFLEMQRKSEMATVAVAAIRVPYETDALAAIHAEMDAQSQEEKHKTAVTIGMLQSETAIENFKKPFEEASLSSEVIINAADAGHSVEEIIAMQATANRTIETMMEKKTIEEVKAERLEEVLKTIEIHKESDKASVMVVATHQYDNGALVVSKKSYDEVQIEMQAQSGEEKHETVVTIGELQSGSASEKIKKVLEETSISSDVVINAAAAAHSVEVIIALQTTEKCSMSVEEHRKRTAEAVCEKVIEIHRESDVENIAVAV